MKVKAIHQFHSGSAYGDAVTNGMFLIRDILRKLGFKSEIYVEHVDRKLKKELKHYSQYKTDPQNILLVHHSLGHDLDFWLKSLKDKIVLIYHNITPEKFFPEGSLLWKYARKGREQLKLLKEISLAAIADSKINKQELISLGFPSEKVWVIPLLFDIEKIIKHPYNFKIIDNYGSSFNILFVGRIVKNKKQDELVDIFNYFRKLSDKPSKLILVGGVTDSSYEKLVKEKVERYGLKLGEEVVLTGKVPYEDLYAYYRCADVFLCMSEHEGFGVPLVESFAFGVPVVAYDAPDSNIKHTLNGGGVLIKERDFKKIAAFLSILSKNRVLLREVLKTQREAISVYEKKNIVKNFVNFLENILGVEIPKDYRTVFSREFNRREIDFQIEGPFDSSYSLAIVNREMARALNNLFPGKVALYSTEGPGDFEPNREFLKENKDIEKMWRKSEKGYRRGVLLRNLYPPRVSDMKAYINLMNSYGWEESEFPKEYLRNFNRYLDALPVMSPYVKKIMIDNGIAIPVFPVGLGVDHILKVKPKYYPLRTKKSFKFLHVSSCFPRKGIDILLDAYASAFTDKDDVVLIIKTFPNPHNNVEKLVEELRKRKNSPEIEVINKDLPDSYLVGLYKQCDCLVQPTRGEGFGLPMAEAMLFELPVITTAFGGQIFFCREDNSWLVDYQFSKARTHMRQFNSYWIEPNKESLIKAMREVYTLSEEKKKEKTEKAKQFVLKNFTWEKSAERLLKVRDYVEKLPIFPERKLKVGWVSTWNTRCGIATYSHFLTENFSEDVELFVIANRVSNRDILDPKLEENVHRIWNLGGKSDDVERILNFVVDNSIDSVVFQYNFGFIDIKYLGKLVKLLKEKGINVFITFHSVKDVDKPDFKASIRWVIDEIKEADRIFVHSIADMNYLKNIGLVDNVALFPHGVKKGKSREEEVERLRKEFYLEGKRIIGAFGFLLPHKGILELIEAFSVVKNKFKDIHLLLLNSLYPIKESKNYRKLCQQRIKELNLEDSVTLITDFIPEDEVPNYIELMDFLVYPYQHTQESASGAVRYGLSLKKPVVCTPLDIFSDVSDVVIFTEDTSVKSIVKILEELLRNPNLLWKRKGEIERWLESVSWEVLSERLENIIRYFKLYGKAEI